MPPRLYPPSRPLARIQSRTIGLSYCPSCSLWRLALPRRKSGNAFPPTSPNIPRSATRRAQGLETSINSLDLVNARSLNAFRTYGTDTRHIARGTRIQGHGIQQWIAPMSSILLPNAPPSCQNLPIQWHNQTRLLSTGAIPSITSKQPPIPRLASQTALNAPSEVPPKMRELYDALKALEKEAGEYVNLSRLGLALRGLEQERKIVRVAVLGMRGMERAMRLVGVLLADETESKTEKRRSAEKERVWEELEKTLMDGKDGRAILIRYGIPSPIPSSSNPLLREIVVPSPFLKNHSLELFVSALNVSASPGELSDTDSAQDALLVPLLEMPTSAGGRGMTMVRFPVHRSILVGEGVGSAVEFGQFVGGRGIDGEMVKMVVDVPGSPQGKKESEIIDLTAAEKARGLLKEGDGDSQDWTKSGVPNLVDWLASSEPGAEASASSLPLNPALRNLISSILTDASVAITTAESQAISQTLSRSISPNTPSPAISASILRALDTWAEEAHTELRDSLDVAFASETWDKLKWWKLLWRVDDVGMVLEDVLNRAWLVEAEKGVVFLAGRVRQAGYLDTVGDGEDVWGTAKLFPRTKDIIPTATSTPEALGKEQKTPPNVSVATTAASGQVSTGVTTTTAAGPNPAASATLTEPTLSPPLHSLKPKPYPHTLPLARAHLIATSVPPLIATAQSSLVTFLSTLILSFSSSALLYVSIASWGVFEAGAFAALGCVVAARRLQRKWEGTREGWGVGVREEGRKWLGWSTEGIRGVVERRGRSGVQEERIVPGVGEKVVARVAVGRVKEVLKGSEEGNEGGNV
ncbi:hypothetical protein K402DRAFT_459946 [Aulographum hederae CBS 113979]|uniref:Mmc1 C-terminal domain-containing protein n=1 Tax=Aulographum hederae CBS 113979 TaxID=1176131 RepID=A0A6G1HDB7_9PEZI|nr:hypothetical protein K402DRAFT_459946 [Aulographum hederae CBS 113979]